MTGILLATHGNFAIGIKQSASMVFGDQPNVEAVILKPEEGPEDIRRKMEEAVKTFDDPDNVLILVDLWGGTPFNQAHGFISGHEEKWAIIAGLNLPMLIEAYGSRETVESAQELAVEIMNKAKGEIKMFPESLKPKEAASKRPATAVSGGNTAENGKMKYVLSRVDSRLLHGQVATAWTKSVKPDRIIVVSDSIAHNELRKKMIQEAAPPGVKANVIPLSKMVQVNHDPRFDGSRVMLLFESPQEALTAIQAGVEIKELNIGSMAYSQGKVVVNKALSLDESDVMAFEELKREGVSFDIRKVPADSKENMDDILRKAREELKKQKK